MDLFSRFRKDYLNYLISIIIPVIINAVSIPLFKHSLGPEGYGNFSITFNFALLCTALLTGWVTQSIIRYFPGSHNKKSFAKQSLFLTGITLAIFFLPALLTIWYLKRDWILATLFASSLTIISMQFTILALSQVSFLSRKNIYSELIRTVTYITCALLLLNFAGINYMYSLFTAIFISYLLSFLYLLFQTNKIHTATAVNTEEEESIVKLFRSFFWYGGPLSLWFVFAYLISLIDKFFMLKALGAEAQGNYQAMFDFLSKSITILISPVIISLFPLLTAAYQKNENSQIRKLLATIIGLEAASMFVAAGLYWWFGADVLFLLVKTPATNEYKLMGLIVIFGTFIWQMAIVVQKRFELKFRSLFLLGMVAIAFGCQLLFYLLSGKENNILLYPIGYAVSSLIYLFLVSFSLIKRIF